MTTKAFILFAVTAVALQSRAQEFANPTRTETKDDAGQQGSKSGFFETVSPSANYPVGASGFWHLLDVRHTNTGNNFAMQFAGSFYDQDLWFRKTSGNPSQGWSRVLMADAEGSVTVPTVVGRTTGYGNRLYLGTDGNNSDPLWIGRYNVANDNTELRVNIGDDGGDRFVVGYHSWEDGLYKPQFTFLASGNMGIGTSNPTERLAVNGTIRSQEVRVEAGPWPDYVFHRDYRLPSLDSLSATIGRLGHLPGMPSAADVRENGVALGEMNRKLLEKVEELTLLLIEQNRKLESQGCEIKELKRAVSARGGATEKKEKEKNKTTNN